MVEFDSGTIFKLHRIDENDIGTTVRNTMLPDEVVVGVFKTVRDRIIFTDRRLIAVDVKGMGKKQDITSIPYRSVVKFSIQTSGIIDTDSELEMHLICGETLAFEFLGSKHVPAIGQALARFCL